MNIKKPFKFYGAPSALNAQRFTQDSEHGVA